MTSKPLKLPTIAIAVIFLAIFFSLIFFDIWFNVAPESRWRGFAIRALY